MSDAGSLAVLCLQHAPAGCGTAPAERLEPLLRSLFEQGRAAWPGPEVSAADFVRHLAERLAPERGLEEALQACCGTDLYLACALAQGQPAALDLFERHFLSQVPAYVGGQRPTVEMVDELKQLLRVRLFVAGPGSRPRIAEYSGSGPLGGWVRIVAVRTTIDLKRQKGGQEARRGRGDSLLDRMAGAGVGADLAHLKARYKDSVNAALRDALRSLDPEERAALRLHFVNGLTYERLAKVLGISRATAVRRVKEARVSVDSRANRLLAERLQLSPSELRSVIRLLKSQLDEGILKSFLEEGEGPPDE